MRADKRYASQNKHDIVLEWHYAAARASSYVSHCPAPKEEGVFACVVTRRMTFLAPLLLCEMESGEKMYTSKLPAGALKLRALILFSMEYLRPFLVRNHILRQLLSFILLLPLEPLHILLFTDAVQPVEGPIS